MRRRGRTPSRPRTARGLRPQGGLRDREYPRPSEAIGTRPSGHRIPAGAPGLPGSAAAATTPSGCSGGTPSGIRRMRPSCGTRPMPDGVRAFGMPRPTGDDGAAERTDRSRASCNRHCALTACPAAVRTDHPQTPSGVRDGALSAAKAVGRGMRRMARARLLLCPRRRARNEKDAGDLHPAVRVLEPDTVVSRIILSETAHPIRPLRRVKRPWRPASGCAVSGRRRGPYPKAVEMPVRRPR